MFQFLNKKAHKMKAVFSIPYERPLTSHISGAEKDNNLRIIGYKAIEIIMLTNVVRDTNKIQMRCIGRLTVPNPMA